MKGDVFNKSYGNVYGEDIFNYALAVKELEPVPYTKPPLAEPIKDYKFPDDDIILPPPPKPILLTINASAGPGGYITPSGSFKIARGLGKIYQIVPNAGYEIDYVKVNGVNKGAIKSYTFSNVTSNQSIQAYFKQKIVPPPPPITYGISASAGTGGSITPSGNVKVSKGASKSFTITPNSGYLINYVKVNGVNKGAISSYKFTNISNNQKIEAFFKPNILPPITFTISALAGPGGTITPSGSIKILKGSNRSFTIAPNSGYLIDYVKVNGENKGPISSYRFSNIASNQKIEAFFKPIIITDEEDLGEDEFNDEDSFILGDEGTDTDEFGDEDSFILGDEGTDTDEFNDEDSFILGDEETDNGEVYVAGFDSSGGGFAETGDIEADVAVAADDGGYMQKLSGIKITGYVYPYGFLAITAVGGILGFFVAKRFKQGTLGLLSLIAAGLMAGSAVGMKVKPPLKV